MKFIRGPVFDHRLGTVLMVDPVPPKTCNRNCIYCELGPTDRYVIRRREFAPVSRIVDELKASVNRLYLEQVRFVSISGSGEPLLYKPFDALVRGIRQTVDVPIAVETNGSFLASNDVRKAMADVDVVVASLDAGDADLYNRINRPHPRFPYGAVLEGLRAFRAEYQGRLWIDVTLIKGLNDTDAALEALAFALGDLRPDEIHISLPTHRSAEIGVEPASDEGLIKAIAMLRRVALVIHPDESAYLRRSFSTPESGVLSVLRRHPMTLEALDRALPQWAPGTVGATVYALERAGAARHFNQYGTAFWSAA